MKLIDVITKTPETVAIEECPCDGPTCRVQMPTGGMMYQGSGYDPIMAARLVHSYNLLPRAYTMLCTLRTLVTKQAADMNELTALLEEIEEVRIT